MSEHVAILGLGTMGLGMAGRVAQAGFPLAVWNRTASRADGLRSSGVRVGATPRDAVRDATCVISMLSDDKASREVWLGENGALAGLAPGALLIESSTVSPVWVRELGAAARAHGSTLIDAPVNGSRVHAASGELKFMIGGDAKDVERATPLLRAMGTEIAHIGPLGSGATVKLVNNFLCGVQAAAFGEALALLDKSGLDLDKALPILVNGAPGSGLVKNVAGRVAAHDTSVHFYLGLMQKDLTYAVEEGRRHALDLRTAALARDLFRAAAENGFASSDLSAITEYLRGLSPESRAKA
ncbi:MAG: NAD(P)-dependent oxidoreductase [Candidatus Acidiferrales bacterium]